MPVGHDHDVLLVAVAHELIELARLQERAVARDEQCALEPYGGGANYLTNNDVFFCPGDLVRAPYRKAPHFFRQTHG